MPCSYYDIDAILAEEELVPCTLLIDFSHLAHLDPDAAHFGCGGGGGGGGIAENGTEGGESTDNNNNGINSNNSNTRKRRRPDHRLPEGSRIKVPLWSMEKWALLGYVRVGLPRHYGRRARERLEADPGSADLRIRNERFYMSGMILVNLIERCSEILAQNSATARSRNRSANNAAIAKILTEARELRRTLHLTYTGERLRRIFDWTLSSIDDDVSSFTKRLTALEMRLFKIGSNAATAHASWKVHGSRRIVVSETALRAVAMQTRVGGGEGVAYHEKQT